MPEQTDEAVAIQVQAGDRESFGLLVERFEPKMTRYARKFLFDGEEVKDLVQDIFIKAYTNIKSFDVKRRFSPWIYRIAHNEFVNALKKKKQERLSFLNLDTVFPSLIARETADKGMKDEDAKRFLDQCLDELDPKYREPLILYHLEDMSYQEIADILQIPVSTVGVRLQRGKIAIQKFVEAKGIHYE